jgi:deoxyribodipyrimidine photo-lyase
MQPIIHWFREDLRLEDNPALSAASQLGFPVIALYILDEDRHHPFKVSKAQNTWLHLSLKSLEKSLKKYSIPLLLEKGHPLEIWERLIKKFHPYKVTWNRTFIRDAHQRDQKIEHLLKAQSIGVETFNGTYFTDPAEIKNQTGGFYKVFAPFLKCHQKAYRPQKIPKLYKNSRSPKVDSLAIEDLNLLDKALISPQQVQEYWQPGEQGAKKRLHAFVKNSLHVYHHHRDFPGLDKTSKLSPHLHFGEISPRAVFEACHGSKAFLRELVFRDFAIYLLYHCPSLPSVPFIKEFEKWKWSDNKNRWEAWKQGETGYPLVDAGMRQLLQTGFMHNRVRMVVASFLIKDLNIAWQKGAAWFFDHLLDADIGNNSYNWQWSAGTGLDAQPFFRIFNPTLQSKKFDPQGYYIRKWVPELKNLPPKYLHTPWKAPDKVLEAADLKLGRDYPFPIVDHEEARQFALKEYKRIKK